MKSLIPLFALFALTLSACPTGEEGEDPGEHACEHITEAGTAVTAAADRDSSGDAEITMQDEPWDVALTSGEEGWLSIVVDEDHGAILFADTADVVTGLFHNDETEDELPTAAPNAYCSDDIPEHWDLDLHEGTWHLQLGPAAVDGLWLMLIEGEHEHEE